MFAITISIWYLDRRYERIGVIFSRLLALNVIEHLRCSARERCGHMSGHSDVIIGPLVSMKSAKQVADQRYALIGKIAHCRVSLFRFGISSRVSIA
jgi:hypothetical protein